MAEELDPLPTLRAVVDTVVPGRPDDPSPGAVEAGCERYLMDVLGRVGPDVAGGLAMLLNIFAQTVGGTAFVELDRAGRESVLRAIGEQPDEEVRQIGRTLMALTIAAYYGEWSGLDAAGHLERKPLSWDLVGYPGPASGYELRGMPPEPGDA